MDERICLFLKESIIAVIAAQSEDGPYCFSCFFAFDEESNSIIFKSSESTQHAKFLSADSRTAGCVNSSETSVTHLKGIQFIGSCFSIKTEDSLIACYKKKYPFAVFKSGDYWNISLNEVKFTDNRLGFGTKLTWKRT